jgi:hypothetical protein
MMIKNLKVSMLLVLILGNVSFGWAQQSIEMADVMRSNGKIYVVVAVLLLILLGLIAYLVVLDRKVSKLEKQKP